MKADPQGVLTGTHFIDGDHACGEGALAAGARFAAGYPITPSTEVIVVSYGITSRVTQRAMELARQRGLRVGKLRLITCWPFPEKRIHELAATTRAFVVPELNLGQMVREVERAAGGKARTLPVPHAGGSVHRPEDILKVVEEASR